MPRFEDLEQAVLRAVVNANAVLPEDQQLDARPGALLASRLDSLGLANLLVAVDAELEALGTDIPLSDALNATAEDGPLQFSDHVDPFPRRILGAFR